VLGYDFAQEEKGGDYEKAEEILTSGMRVHRTILPKVVYQIENQVRNAGHEKEEQMTEEPARFDPETRAHSRA